MCNAHSSGGGIGSSISSSSSWELASRSSSSGISNSRESPQLSRATTGGGHKQQSQPINIASRGTTLPPPSAPPLVAASPDAARSLTPTSAAAAGRGRTSIQSFMAGARVPVALPSGAPSTHTTPFTAATLTTASRASNVGGPVTPTTPHSPTLSTPFTATSRASNVGGPVTPTTPHSPTPSTPFTATSRASNAGQPVIAPSALRPSTGVAPMLSTGSSASPLRWALLSDGATQPTVTITPSGTLNSSNSNLSAASAGLPPPVFLSMPPPQPAVHGGVHNSTAPFNWPVVPLSVLSATGPPASISAVVPKLQLNKHVPSASTSTSHNTNAPVAAAAAIQSNMSRSTQANTSPRKHQAANPARDSPTRTVGPTDTSTLDQSPHTRTDPAAASTNKSNTDSSNSPQSPRASPPPSPNRVSPTLSPPLSPRKRAYYYHTEHAHHCRLRSDNSLMCTCACWFECVPSAFAQSSFSHTVAASFTTHAQHDYSFITQNTRDVTHVNDLTVYVQ